ncbi:MAG: Hsp20/alpha crystallin family protein, partial [Candidatus Moraniibacteriota bacterium]
MITKEKSSFFERLTGAKKLDEQMLSHEPISVYSETEETELVTRNHPQEESRSSESWFAPTMPSASNQNESDGEGQLTIDVYQTESDIVIKSTIAGVKPEDLDVTINNDMVTVKGDRKNEEVVENGNYYYQECYWGSFSRSVLLPVDVIPDKVDASLKNGILT